MEKKPARSKISIFSFLHKTSSFSFSNHPFSPGHDKRTENLNKFKANAGRGFSGPIVSIIPAEARRKTKNGSFDEQEPTSPKVSCIGQIKQKKKIVKPKSKSPPKDRKKAKAQFKIGRIFHVGRRAGDDEPEVENNLSSAPVPSLSQMKRFASGRSTLADFDWRTPGGAVSSHRGYYSDEDKRDGRDDEDDDDDDDDDFGVPHSAPLVVGGGVALGPRNEGSIWKRRTMDPPRSLDELKVKDMDKHT